MASVAVALWLIGAVIGVLRAARGGEQLRTRLTHEV
jgi:hypothetical protein